MGAVREKDQADFDLERFVNMFDEAMTSSDPRVVETLRSLMMIVALTRPESRDVLDTRKGPLRRAFEDMNHLWKRLEQMEQELRQMHQQLNQQTSLDDRWPRGYRSKGPEDQWSMAAAVNMAQSVDQDLMRQITQKINSPGLNSPNMKPSAGKLYK